MKTVVITQARMTSTRLPGKVLAPLAGIPCLVWHLRRLKLCKHVDHVVVATTDRKVDDVIALAALAEGAEVYRDNGPENDVLGRYAAAAVWAAADRIVRVTSDCPFIEPTLVDMVARHPGDYVSNVDRRTYPKGLDAEAFSAGLLKRADENASDPYDREHVTPWMRVGRRWGTILNPDDYSHRNWSLDTAEDYRRLDALARRVWVEAHWTEILLRDLSA